MNLVISKPEIPFEVAKAIFVVIPRAMEADRSVLSSLEHDPASTVSLQVAVYLKICFPVGVYRVQSTRSVASEKDVNTSPCWIENKIGSKLNLPFHIVQQFLPTSWESLLLIKGMFL